MKKCIFHGFVVSVEKGPLAKPQKNKRAHKRYIKTKLKKNNDWWVYGPLKMVESFLGEI